MIRFLNCFFICSVWLAQVKGNFISENTFKWIMVNESTPCSKECGSGFRNISYKCTVYHDPSGITTATDDEECATVSRPPDVLPCNRSPCKKSPIREPRRIQRYEWLRTGAWSDCVNGCFGGTHCAITQCFDNRHNNWAPKYKCKNVPKPANLCKKCREYTSCPAVWSISGWTPCSRTCGRGYRYRSVSCIKPVDSVNVIHVPYDECPGDDTPRNIATCAVKDCPAKFVTSKWGPCSGASSWNCGIGTKKRKVSCARQSRKGVMEKLAFRVCYLKHGAKNYPKPWQPCLDYSVSISEECREKQRNTKIFIHRSNASIIQMRHVKRMTLQVGEMASVFPRTSLVIKCPVTGFDPRDLIWFHNGRRVSLTGRRIHMNFRGRLKIRSSRKRDAGDWRCVARNESANVSLNLRHPSDGFREYAVRLPMISLERRNEMLSDSPAGSSGLSPSVGETAQWVASAWSQCSRSCGSVGKMKRKVQCERVKGTFYKVFLDEVCEKQGLRKPPVVKKCGSFAKCPEWRVNKKEGKCTDVCVGIDRALLKNKIFCAIGRQMLAKDSCDAKKRPKGLDFCENQKCRPRWKVSKWSKCSRSCGGVGVQARHLECVWVHNGDNAGTKCYMLNIQPPQVIKYCHTPRCVLECVDRSKQCPRIRPKMCRYTSYQRYCCNTCAKHMKMIRRRKRRRPN